MNPERIRITPGTRQKYVLVRIVTADTGEIILWGNPDIQWHKDIVDEMTKAGAVVSEVLGGGWLLLKPEEGVLYVWGKSDRYGEVPRNILRDVVGDTYSLVEQEAG